MAAKKPSYWLVKQEPEAYSWSQLVADTVTAWTGVRNFQARNHLRAMATGDLVFFYHSVSEKQVVGLARVQAGARPDPTAEAGEEWVCVDLVPVRTLNRPVTLGAIKADPRLKELALLRQSRLSVMPVSPQEAEVLLELAGG